MKGTFIDDAGSLGLTEEDLERAIEANRAWQKNPPWKSREELIDFCRGPTAGPDALQAIQLSRIGTTHERMRAREYMAEVLKPSHVVPLKDAG